METTRKTARPFSPTGIFWNERGMICCEHHVPHPGSDTWQWERWNAMAVEDAEAWRSENGELPQCECCGERADVEPF